MDQPYMDIDGNYTRFEDRFCNELWGFGCACSFRSRFNKLCEKEPPCRYVFGSPRINWNCDQYVSPAQRLAAFLLLCYRIWNSRTHSWCKCLRTSSSPCYFTPG